MLSTDVHMLPLLHNKYQTQSLLQKAQEKGAPQQNHCQMRFTRKDSVFEQKISQLSQWCATMTARCYTLKLWKRKI